jgi:hypothetical protein
VARESVAHTLTNELEFDESLTDPDNVDHAVMMECDGEQEGLVSAGEHLEWRTV